MSGCRTFSISYRHKNTTRPTQNGVRIFFSLLNFRHFTTRGVVALMSTDWSFIQRLWQSVVRHINRQIVFGLFNHTFSFCKKIYCLIVRHTGINLKIRIKVVVLDCENIFNSIFRCIKKFPGYREVCDKRVTGTLATSRSCCNTLCRSLHTNTSRNVNNKQL